MHCLPSTPEDCLYVCQTSSCSPLGESLPSTTLLKALWNAIGIDQRTYVKGPESGAVFELSTGPSSVSICFDLNFADTFVNTFPEGEYALVLSKDVMFEGGTQLEQQTQIMRARALESGRWFYRVSTSRRHSDFLPQRPCNEKVFNTRLRGNLCKHS